MSNEWSAVSSGSFSRTSKQGCSRGRNVTVTPQKHSTFRRNENEQRAFKGQSRQ